MSPSDQPEGSGVTVKVALVAFWPFTVTENGPDDAPDGTRTSTTVSVQPTDIAAVPLSDTVLLPCEAPKFVPFSPTTVPTGPEVVEILVIVGAWASARPQQKNTKQTAVIGISFHLFIFTVILQNAHLTMDSAFGMDNRKGSDYW